MARRRSGFGVALDEGTYLAAPRNGSSPRVNICTNTLSRHSSIQVAMVIVSP